MDLLVRALVMDLSRAEHLSHVRVPTSTQYFYLISTGYLVYQFALLFNLVVLCIGHWFIETGRTRTICGSSIYY